MRLNGGGDSHPQHMVQFDFEYTSEVLVNDYITSTSLVFLLIPVSVEGFVRYERRSCRVWNR